MLAPPKIQAFFEALQELRGYVEATFGLFHDAAAGFGHFSKRVESIVDDEVKLGLALNDALQLPLIYNDQPRLVAAPLHRSTMGAVIDRCRPHGSNEVFLGNMCVVAIYTFWELRARHRIADAVGIPVNNVKSDVFGDLRLLRHAIIHQHGLASPEMEKTRVLKWFSTGQEIVVDREKLKAVVELVRELPEGLTTEGFKP